MRRHINRYSPAEELLDSNGNTVEFPYARRRINPTNLPKRGEKNHERRWPLIRYTIQRGVGVVMEA